MEGRIFRKMNSQLPRRNIIQLLFLNKRYDCILRNEFSYLQTSYMVHETLIKTDIILRQTWLNLVFGNFYIHRTHFVKGALQFSIPQEKNLRDLSQSNWLASTFIYDRIMSSCCHHFTSSRKGVDQADAHWGTFILHTVWKWVCLIQ